MGKKTIYREDFLVGGIMCYQGCGVSIYDRLQDLEKLKQNKLLPQDAQLIIDAEPQALGIHRLILLIESKEDYQPDVVKLNQEFSNCLQEMKFSLVDEEDGQQAWTTVNWLNIAINLAAIALIITLSILFPPSLPLTIGLTVFSFAITAFTARHHLWNFFSNLRHKQIATMSTPITLGWFLSLAHTLYHGIMMPMMRGFSTVFMNYVMPVMLITFINGLDEIKRLVLNKSRKMQVQGMKSLFPQMAESYPYFPSFAIQEETENQQDLYLQLQQLLTKEYDEYPKETIGKNAIKKGMLILVKRGECFPVDGMILQSTCVDASLLTGEPSQNKHPGEAVPAGAINLGQDVFFYALEDCYSSTINKLLFRANRASTQENKPHTERNFSYWYSGLIGSSVIAAVVVPAAFKIITIPLVLQNVAGVLFAVCPCTITIAHQLPKLLSIFQRHKKGIILRNEQLLERSDEIETIVFDKTGTLTTGNSQVEESEGISDALWQRIYLLEKAHGGQHPLAKAVINHWEKGNGTILINDVRDAHIDANNRGLSARIQDKKVVLGNLDYLRHCKVNIPDDLIPQDKLALGYTPIYVAEDDDYCGYILVKHEIRPNILPALQRLKRQGKKIILLTGDNEKAALGFNHCNGAIFAEEDIHAGKTPEGKEQFLKQYMQTHNPRGVWFVGDGLNDTLCARAVSELGGVSCSITSDDKAAFFTDVSLNGSLEYLFQHGKLNRFVKKNIRQNQFLLAYGAMLFLAFIISFSIAGIAVSPLIPMVIMLATTFLVLFNCYRSKLAVDVALDNKVSWAKKYFASDLSLGLLVTSFSLLIAATLIATLATGGFALPFIAFALGTPLLISSICVISAVVVFAVFAALGASWAVSEQNLMNKEEPCASVNITPDSNFEEEELRQSPGLEFFPAQQPASEEGNFSYVPELKA